MELAREAAMFRPHFNALIALQLDPRAPIAVGDEACLEVQ
jgi:hypothetical protein